MVLEIGVCAANLADSVMMAMDVPVSRQKPVSRQAPRRKVIGRR